MNFETIERFFKLTQGRVSNSEIKKLSEFVPGQCLPCGLNFVDKLWWRFVPGTVINVRWPTGPVIINKIMQLPSYWDRVSPPKRYVVESTDPNDHYRPWLEKHVGRQGWDWNWGMTNHDVMDNRLTIKIRQSKAKYATIAAMKWS